MAKILVTIGPTSSVEKNLKKILNQVKLVRFNLSHNTIDWHKNIIYKINKIDSNIKILVDIPGIKPRTLNKENIDIKKNDLICFSFIKKSSNKNIPTIFLSNPLPLFKNINLFSVDDGKYTFKVIKYNKNFLIGKSKQSFALKSNKGLNIPKSLFSSKLQEKKYIKYINLIKKWPINSIGLSYIQDSQTIEKIRKLYPELIITSKIENFEGLMNIENICEHSDIIMIDRGDLSAELGEEKLFTSMLKIIEVSKRFGKPIIMATENLDSMSINDAPNKSEIISIGFSNLLEVDCIMLSEETAISKNWESTLKWLVNFYDKSNNDNLVEIAKEVNNNHIWKLISNFTNIKIVMFLKKGYAVNEIKKINKKVELIIFTDNKKLLSLTQFYTNITSIKVDYLPKKIENKFIFKNIKRNYKTIFKNNDKILIVYTAYARKKSRANSFSILEKKDFL